MGKWLELFRALKEGNKDAVQRALTENISIGSLTPVTPDDTCERGASLGMGVSFNASPGVTGVTGVTGGNPLKSPALAPPVRTLRGLTATNWFEAWVD
jgi:hypothetical protein